MPIWRIHSGKLKPLFFKARQSRAFSFMTSDTDKPRKPIPVSVVTYRVQKPDEKEIRRLLGRDLEDAARRNKGR